MERLILWRVFEDFISALTDMLLILNDIDPYLIAKWVYSFSEYSSWVLAIEGSKYTDNVLYINCKCIVSGVKWWIKERNQ